MRITGSELALTGSYSYTEKYSRKESIRFWTDNRLENEEKSNLLQDTLQREEGDILELSPEAKRALADTAGITSQNVEEIKRDLITEREKQKILLLEKILSALTGKKVKFKILDPEQLLKAEKNPVKNMVKEAAPDLPEKTNRVGWGMEYQLHESYEENEKMSFSAHGIVKTSDGTEINFHVELNISRNFMIENHLDIRAGDAQLIDPLIINYNGQAADFADTNFTFDLDADGLTEQIPLIRQGSGFLAMDKNNNGIIDNGKELFGPSGGDGFAELAAYDLDNNDWLDENDPVFDNLLIWTKDEKGRDELFALSAAGVGAVYLGNINTAFSYKDNENRLQAQNQKTGVFLREDGTAGTLQQVDFTVSV